jgi:glutaminyl-peptide cyclotransferase
MTDHPSSLAEPPKGAPRFLALAVVLIIPLILLGCPSGTRKSVNANQTAPPDTSSSAAKFSSDFDGERALEHVRQQVEFGPRPAGSAELEKTRAYLIDQLKSYGLKVTTDEFHPVTPLGDRKMVNITAELPGESNDVIIISSHYDTKLFKQFKFVGANDGGASTGALLELARAMALNKAKPRLTYWFVFFDGEEAFCEDWDQCHNPNPADPKTPLPDNTYGSRRYVAQLTEKNELKRVRAMILFDMMGYKNLLLGRDDMSTTWLVDTVWQTAKQLGHGAIFVDAREGVGGDDHEPFLRAGIDSLDIIQLSTYKSSNGTEYWHTKEDTLDKVSAKSLKIVGDVVLASLPKIEERLQNRSR